jgi:pyrroloquinoline-quinone synthase
MQNPTMLCLAAADEILLRHSIPSHPYLRDLRDGSLTREHFCATQRQFLFAVRFFSRPMAALMARLPDSSSRQALMHNLAEEHGYDEHHGGFRAGMAHDHTFLAFLASLGVPREAALAESVGAPVRAFNLALHGACLSDTPAFAFAALGMIEYMFADISAIIGQAVVERGWIPRDQLVHYTLHAEIDRRHAADFFAAVEPEWRSGGAEAGEGRAGLEFGHHIFDRLYTELHALA